MKNPPGPKPKNVMHLGRSFVGNPLEKVCPCQKAPCGLIRDSGIDEDCTEHPMSKAKTIRQMHWEHDCPESQTPTPPIKFTIV